MYLLKIAETIIGAEYTLDEKELVDLYDKLIILYEFRYSKKIEHIIFDVTEASLEGLDFQNILNFKSNNENLPEINDFFNKIKQFNGIEEKKTDDRILMFLKKRRNLF